MGTLREFTSTIAPAGDITQNYQRNLLNVALFILKLEVPLWLIKWIVSYFILFVFHC